MEEIKFISWKQLQFKYLVVMGVLLLSICYNGYTQEKYELPKELKRIVFLGNSITYQGDYIAHIESHLRLFYPSRQFEFINQGLSSETVSGLSEPNHAGGKFPRPDLHDRLDRLLKNLKPDLVIACYGMNDGIYLPFDERRFKKFKVGINRLHKKVEKSGAKIIHLTPAVYDGHKGESYALVLDLYSDWLKNCRYAKNWKVIDLHWPMKKYLEDQRLINSSFRFAKDGIHPNEIGHWLMAKQVLLYMGIEGVNNTNDIDSSLASLPMGDSILSLVKERQKILRDAWLTKIGTKRPGLQAGLPIVKAQEQADLIDKKIRNLVK